MQYIILSIKYILGYCNCCNKYFKYSKRRRLNTQYEEEDRNYLTSCDSCYRKTINYYNELWDTFYGEKI
jgi:hypothetical protein